MTVARRRAAQQVANVPEQQEPEDPLNVDEQDGDEVDDEEDVDSDQRDDPPARLRRLLLRPGVSAARGGSSGGRRGVGRPRGSCFRQRAPF